MRVVLDTNVVVSSFIAPASTPARVLALMSEDQFELLVSEAILAEYEAVLKYPRIQARHRRSDSEVADIVAGFRALATVIEPTRRLDIVQDDADDNKLLECAVEGGAEIIASGDSHLLSLKGYEGIEILSPAAFLAAFG
ncbi:MAG: putative toxin-antitoxin system toxin component, PIN family [Anaerolineae bacterium]